MYVKYMAPKTKKDKIYDKDVYAYFFLLDTCTH